MRSRSPRVALAWLLLLGCGGFGCGKSGSGPVVYPEVRIEVQPAGLSTFTVNSLVAAGVNHPSVVGQEFSATALFTFALENAPPPYEASFTRLSGGDITVTLTFESATGQTVVTDSTGPDKDTAVVIAGGAPTVTPGAQAREVRFDVCAPSADSSTCSTTGDDAGVFGVLFNGTAGDTFVSHLLNGATPTIYFIEAARETVDIVVTRNVVTGDPLVVELFIDGELRQTGSNKGQVIISEDL